jgi:glycosyltransferase involved in cell wall biosynthesis
MTPTAPSIRVIAIACNEAAGIAGYFAQFAMLTRDFCLLDTGSTDDTPAIARANGVHVESTGFVDFASARNEALARFAAGADWIVMFDPDERLDAHTIEHLGGLVRDARHDVLLAPNVARYADGSRRAFTPKVFAFRNRPALHWVFKVHEKLVGSQRQALVRNARIEHVIALHAPERRARAAAFYEALAAQEPYFTDAAYRQRMRDAWPILDHERLDDARLAKIVAGPCISAIVPTYARCQLLAQAVRSAAAQDYANLDIVVVADHDPEFAAIARDCAALPRVRAIDLARHHGGGGAGPRNAGIADAYGEFIAYLDDDNTWSPDHVSSVYRAMAESGAAFGFSSMSVDGADLGFDRPELTGIDTSTIVHRRALVSRYGGWRDRRGFYAHDWELVSRWLAGGEPWVATRRATVQYGTLVNGQQRFMRGLARERADLAAARAGQAATRQARESRAISPAVAPEARWSARDALLEDTPSLVELAHGAHVRTLDVGDGDAACMSLAALGDGYVGIRVRALREGHADATDAAQSSSVSRVEAMRLDASFAMIAAAEITDRLRALAGTRAVIDDVVAWQVDDDAGPGWACLADAAPCGAGRSLLLRLRALACIEATPLAHFGDPRLVQRLAPFVDGGRHFLQSLAPTIVIDAGAGGTPPFVVSGVDPGLAVDHWQPVSPLIACDDGWLGIVREVAPHAAAHRFVWLDARRELAASSDAFHVRARGSAERIGGLTFTPDGSRIVASGATDALAWVASMTPATLRAVLHPLPVAVRRPPACADLWAAG